MTSLPLADAARFDCPRTCPQYERADVCRFRPVLDWLGDVRITSHTARVNADYSDPKALQAAVLAMGGQWLGHRMVELFDGSTPAGLAFQLAGWRYPCVLDREKELHYDDYQGKWGNVADLQQLKKEYVWAGIKAEAQKLGWLHEQTDTALLVHHPDGGRIEIGADGAAQAFEFHGHGCHEAILALIPNATDLTPTLEYDRERVTASLPESR